MIDGRTFFDQPVKNDLKTYDNIGNIATGQGNDYTTGCLLDCSDLSKQQKLQVDPEAMKKTNFAGNQDRSGNTQMFTNFFHN